MMKNHKTVAICAISSLLCLLILSDCDVTDEAHNGTGQITIHLTDAPGNFEAVFVDIESVRIRSSQYQTTDHNKEDDNGWVTINDEPVRIDLLELRNGNTVQIGSEELEAGTYNQIRLVLGPDNEIFIDGTSYPLIIPGTQQSRLKLDINADIEGGEIYNLLIDFDAGRSIVKSDSNNYLLKPVLRTANLEQSGSINGSVQPANTQTSIMAITSEDTLSTLTDEDGNYKITGVTAGTYDVAFVPRSNAYRDTTLTDIPLSSNQDVTINTINLPNK